jgi:hypothetical protein
MDSSGLAELGCDHGFKSETRSERAKAQLHAERQYESWVSCVEIPSPATILKFAVLLLALAYSEHLGPTYGTHTLSGRPAVLHGYALGIFHFPLGTALHAVCLHLFTSLFIQG